MSERFIPVILGTGREGNQSQKVARLLLNSINKKYSSEIFSPRDYLKNFYTQRIGKERPDDETGQKYKQAINKAKSIVVVIPEYNRSFPGELKLMLDLLYTEYKGKKFYLVGVSDGATGGARAVDSFMQAIVGVEGVPVKPRLFFSNVLEVFDDNGNLIASEYEDRIEKFVDSL